MSYYSFPDQTIPETEKDKEWHKQHVLGYVDFSLSSIYSQRRKEIKDIYDKYLQILSDKDKIAKCQTVTGRLGQEFGPQYYVYPLMKIKIEQIIGDYRLRPTKRRCTVNNPRAVSEKLDTKVAYIAEDLVRQVHEEINAEENIQLESENQDLELPNNIEEFFQKDYRTLEEENGEDVLYQLLEVNKEKEQIYKAIHHYLIAQEVPMFIDHKNGHPSLYVPHPLECYYSNDTQKDIQDDVDYFVHDRFMSINDVYNQYNLTKEEKEELKSYINASKEGKSGFTEYMYREEADDSHVRVINMVWKSRRQIRTKRFKNKSTGRTESRILETDYKVRKSDDIRTINVEDSRTITMIGDLVLDFGRLKNQIQRIENPKKRHLPVVVLIGGNTFLNAPLDSLAKRLEYLQDFASEILYEIRVALRKNDGYALGIDTSLLPPQWAKMGPDKALEKALFYLKRDGVVVFNSKNKKGGSYASSFNISQRGRIQDLFSMFQMIDRLADDVSGVNDAMQGKSSPYDTATGIENKMIQASSRIEIHYGLFDSFVDTVLERLIGLSKYIYEDSDVFHYIGGDDQAKFLKLSEKYPLVDLGIHIGDNREEARKKKNIDAMATEAFSNAQTPEMLLELIKIYNTMNSSEAEAVLRKGINSMAELRRQEMEEQNKLQQQSLENERKSKEDDNQLTREGHQKDISVAKIYADNKANDTATKEDNANLRKQAEIKRDLYLSQKEK